MANNTGNGVRQPRTYRNARGRFHVKKIKLATGQSLQTLAGYPGIIKGIALDFSAGANASGVVRVRRGISTGPILFSATTGTDTTNASTGQLLVPCANGLDASNSSLTNVAGQYFDNGLFVEYGSATAGDTVIVKLMIDIGVRYQKVDLVLAGVNGSATATNDLFVGRPGILRAIRVSASAAATADFTLTVDPDTKYSNTLGAAVFTATNFGTTAIEGPTANTAASVCTGGLGITNGAVTSPGGGGMPFLHGIRGVVAQGNSAEVITVEYWIEV